MEYTIKTIEDGCEETITLHDGSTYTRRHKKTYYGSKCLDQDFCEQMEPDGICDEMLDEVNCTFSDFFPSSFMDIAELDC